MYNIEKNSKTIETLKQQVQRGREFFTKTLEILGETRVRLGESQEKNKEFVQDIKLDYDIYILFGDEIHNQLDNKENHK